MSLPTSATYNTNRGRVVQLALTDVGALGPGAVAPTQDAGPLVAHANDLLNILVKSMDADGGLEWRTARRTLTSVAGQASYALPADVYDIDPPARYTLSGQTTGIQVLPMMRDEYMALGDRTITASTPIRYYIERSIDTTSGLESPTLFFYPVPTGAGDTFEYASLLKARDSSTDTDTLDIPQKWIMCLRWGLSLSLAPGYGLPMDRTKFFQEMFAEERERCLADDIPRGDVQLVPFGSSGYFARPYGSFYR